MIQFVTDQRSNGLTDNQISKLAKRLPKTGDKKQFFGKNFIYSNSYWLLDEITHICNQEKCSKNGYKIHSYSM